jgi:membrane-associated phospholipid phosphatase
MAISGLGVDLLREPVALLAPTVAIDARIPKALAGRLAYVISMVGSPPVLAPLAMALVASTIESSAWMWTGGYALITVVVPLFYLVWLKQRGLITDLDVQVREQRTRPMILTLACGGVAWLVLFLGGAPAPMALLAGALWLQMLVICIITLHWKISVHCATAAGVATVLWMFLGASLPLLLGVPLIAWSRVRLRRHTLAQTIAGSVLGTAVFYTAIALARI